MNHLVERLRTGEEEALAEWMDRDGHTALRIALLFLNDQHEAQDAVQEAFILAYQRMEQLSDAEKLTKWLTTIVISQCRRRTRKWSFKHIFLSYKEEPLDKAGIDTPLSILETKETSRQLAGIIQQLEAEYREVIALFYYGEYSIKEISDLTKTKENTVKSRLARARRQLRKFLEEGERHE
ncbi:sigma-70 family RNA polymerase sigma factor [Bacillus sp. FJAT-45037]|uniref:sigma-70 family RNA polymerase sigma factor n=1 Tax=Bacillus sp. FJAT-45037 TaxID=2011007 RepID=UPI0012FDB904|nr:sigma-70 family RNA polymerase sigma factor [Bacillus sp. FJAT-45037]